MFSPIKEFNTSFYIGCVRFVIKPDTSGVRGLLNRLIVFHTLFDGDTARARLGEHHYQQKD